MPSNRRLQRFMLLAATCVSAFAFPAMAFAQASVFRPDRGFLPAGTYSVSQTESVNDSTGTVTARIPLAKLAGKNSSGFSLDLIYNSALYNLQTQSANEHLVMDYNLDMGGVDLNMLTVSSAGGWRYTHSYYIESDYRPGTPPEWRYTLVTGDGGSHTLHMMGPSQIGEDGYSRYDITSQNPFGPNLTFYTTDGSFIRVDFPIGGTAWTAHFPNGDYVSGPIVSNSPGGADQICDRNGNCIHIANTFDGNYTIATELRDDFGRKVMITYGDPRTGSHTDQVLVLPYDANMGTLPSGLAGTDPRNQAAPLTTTIQWNTAIFGPPAGVKAATLTKGVMYQCLSPDGTKDWRCISSFSVPVITQISLPNGLSYDFTYADDSAPASEISQGELREMKLPMKSGETARAEVHYTWSRNETFGTPTPWFDANINPVKQKDLTWREESDATTPVAAHRTWTYLVQNDQSQITAPDGAITQNYFPNRTGTAWNLGLVYKTVSPAGTTWRCWQQNTPWQGWTGANPYVAAEYRQLAGATNAAATTFDYDKNGNLMSKLEYDWVTAPTSDNAPCAVSGTVLRKTENRYWNPPGGAATPMRASGTPTVGLANAYWNTTLAYAKRDSILESRIYAGDETDATKAKALTQFSYDNPNSTGNVTSELHWDNQLPAGAPQTDAPQVATTTVTLNSTIAAVTTRSYSAGGLLSTETDPSGNQTQYTYGQVQKRSDDASSTCPASFAGLGPTSKTAPESQTWQYYYDCATGALNDEVYQTNRNLRTKYLHDIYGRITSETVGFGVSAPDQPRTTTTEYDDSNRQVRVVQDSKLGRVSHFNQLGELYLDRENPDDATSPITTASANDIRTVTMSAAPGDGTPSAPDAVYTLTSNPFLKNGSTSEATLGWTLQKFDQAGRVHDVYYYKGQDKPAPFGTNTGKTGHESYTYTGNTTTFNDAQGNTRTTTTDALGRLASAAEGTLSAATYLYDMLDNLTSVTQTDASTYGTSKSQTRTFVYSSLGRLVSAANPETDNPTTYTYYPNGTLKTSIDARNVTTTNTLVDGLGRVLKKDYSATTPATPGARYCYDGNKYDATSDSCMADSSRVADYSYGALTHTAARKTVNGVATIVSVTQYSRIDALGRVLSSVQTTDGLAAKSFAYTYAAGGALSGVQYPSGNWVTYDVGGANRVTAVRKGASGSTYYLQQAAYKPNGAMKSATIGQDTANQWVETTEYNSRLQPCTMQVQKPSQTLLLGLQWTHSASDGVGACEGTGSDNGGNVVSEQLQYPGLPQPIARNYQCDGANRITSYSEPATGKTQAYSYDAFGNLWQNGAASGVPSLRPNGSSWYLGSDGKVRNRLTGTGYDAAGNQTQLSISAGGTNASYDGEGHLVKVDTGGTPLVTYDYDAEGRRVKRTDASSVVTWYVYDAEGQLMAEYGGTSVTAGTQYVASDQLGSARMLLDGAGNCQARMDYAPFGAMVPRIATCYTGSPASGNPLFTGTARDGDTTAGTETGLDHMGARAYWASLGRFTSPDAPLIDQDPSDPQSWNLYGYVRNNPLIFTDPDGQTCVNGIDDKNGNVCFVATGTAKADVSPVQQGMETALRFLLTATGATIHVAQKTQEALQPIIDWAFTPRNTSCLAASMGAGSAAGTTLGATGLLTGIGVVITVPGGFVGGGFVGGLIGMNACMSGTGHGGGGGNGGRASGSEARLTKPQQRQTAKYLGMKEVKGMTSQGQLVFEKGGRNFSFSNTSHTAGEVFKELDRSGNRIATTDLNLNRIGR